jgi:hypothetical protein
MIGSITYFNFGLLRASTKAKRIGVNLALVKGLPPKLKG